MVFRLPTQLESFIPPPAIQAPNAAVGPWKGQFLVSGTRASDIASNVQIRVTGVETDGETPHSQSHLWPSRFVFSITAPHALPILAQLKTYLRHRSPPIPLTTFMPDRIRDVDQNAVNQTQFRSLSRLLWDGQLVAIVAINLSTSSGTGGRHGILLFPASNTSAILVGAVFLTPADTFPDFVFPQVGGQTPPSFVSTYGSSLPTRGSSTSNPSFGPHTHGYEHHFDPATYDPSRPVPDGHQRHSSHSISPISPADASIPYRYASPAPVMNIASQNRAVYGPPGPYEENIMYTRYQSESPPGSGSAYRYPAQRGPYQNHPHTGYGA